MKEENESDANLSLITRLEIINHGKNQYDVGRLIVLYKTEEGGFQDIEFSVQDDNRTLKIFIK